MTILYVIAALILLVLADTIIYRIACRPQPETPTFVVDGEKEYWRNHGAIKEDSNA